VSDDPNYSYGYANKRIVSDLSQLTSGEELINDKERWSVEDQKCPKWH